MYLDDHNELFLFDRWVIWPNILRSRINFCSLSDFVLGMCNTYLMENLNDFQLYASMTIGQL